MSGTVFVALSEAFSADSSGRLLLLVEPDDGTVKRRLEVNAVFPGNMYVAAQDIVAWGSDRLVKVNTSTNVFPTALSTLPAGSYRMQAVLSRDNRYNHDQGGPGDLFSVVERVEFPLGQSVTLTLADQIPESMKWDSSSECESDNARRASVQPHLQEFKLQSNFLKSFWDHSVALRAWVLLPDDYREDARKTWPTVYVNGVFGATHKSNFDLANYVYQAGISNDYPMIWVFLDYSTPNGPTLYADSANNGPWGSALTEELIPALEQHYRMDARSSGRLLTGHSSGGWASVWLQVRYPKVFGGAWATAPDSLDFRAFLNTNLYEFGANLYQDEKGILRGIARDRNRIITTTRDSARLESLLSPDGGIFRHWECVFSPRGPDGTPLEMFDRADGRVHREVVSYWRDNYDISRFISKHWEDLQEHLDGKLHIFVGTVDDHYLEKSVYKLREVLRELDAQAHFVFLEGRTHNDLYAKDGDQLALLRDMARGMYDVARHGRGEEQ